MQVRELRRRLRRLGCQEVRQSGSHVVVRCGRCQAVIPVHSGEIPRGTLRAIERDPSPAWESDGYDSERIDLCRRG